jgi:hypothetical protein
LAQSFMGADQSVRAQSWFSLDSPRKRARWHQA